MRALLVSRELAPYYGGGIGTYTAAMAASLADAGHDVHILTAPHEGLTPGPLRASVTIHTTNLESGLAALDAYPAYAMRYSMAVYESVQRLAADTHFDLIEFPDYHAEGYFACRAKRTLGRFADSLLAIRLHSASWLCQEADRDARITPEHAYQHHMERAALAECDAIISPGRRILERISSSGGAGGAGAATGDSLHPSMRSLCHEPLSTVIPIPIDVERIRGELGDGTDEPAFSRPETPEILFFGKLQHLKGPHDLVAAALLLLNRAVRVRFRFIGNDSPTGPFGRSMLDYLRSRIPPAQRDSFVFEPARPRARLGRAIRAAVASGGLCCFPSRWEAFPMVCLEAMCLSVPVVASDAGGLSEIIEDGKSGLLFPAGDPAALAATLERALTDTSLRASIASAGPARVKSLCDPKRIVQDLERLVSTRERAATTSPPPRPPVPTRAAKSSAPRASFVIPCFNLGRYLPQTLASIRAQTRQDFETIIIDDGSTDPDTISLLDSLASAPQAPSLRLVRQPNAGLSAARNTGLREARAPWVIPLDADDLIAPTLVEKLLAGAESHPALDYISPLVTYFETDPAIPTGGWVPLGPDRDLLLVRNVGGAASGSLIRKDAALAVGGYDTWMTSYEDWEFWCRLAAAGHRGSILPEFLLHYRVRPDSMFRTEALTRNTALHAYIISKHASLPSDPSRTLRLLQDLADADPASQARTIIRDNMRYRVVDSINDALKRAGVQRALKDITVKVLRAGRRGGARP